MTQKRLIIRYDNGDKIKWYKPDKDVIRKMTEKEFKKFKRDMLNQLKMRNYESR